MDITNAMKAEVLARALPNIQLYRKKTIVVKYGGNAMINEELKESVMRDLVLAYNNRHQGGARARRRPRNKQNP